MFGKIQHYRPDKGYGFIRAEGRDEDIFFNSNVDFEGDHGLLKKGTIVEFGFRKFKGNEIAKDVRIVDNIVGGAL